MAEINNVIAEASQDLQTIEDFVNLPAGSDVRPRLLPSVNVGTLAGTRDAIFRAGGLPAEPFATKALMQTNGASLANGHLAMVYNDTDELNGLYVKSSGAWSISSVDPRTLIKKERLKNGFAVLLPLATSNVNYDTASKTLQLRNTVTVLNSYENTTLSTPVDIAIPNYGVYRLEFNSTSKAFRVVPSQQAVQTGWLQLGYIETAFNSFTTNIVAQYTVDNKTPNERSLTTELFMALNGDVTLDKTAKTISVFSNRAYCASKGRVPIRIQTISYSTDGSYFLLIKKSNSDIALFAGSTVYAAVLSNEYWYICEIDTVEGVAHGLLGRLYNVGGSSSPKLSYALALPEPTTINFDFKNDRIVISGLIWTDYNNTRINIPAQTVALGNTRNKAFRHVLQVNVTTGIVKAVSVGAYTKNASDIIIGAFCEGFFDNDIMFWGLDNISVNGKPYVPHLRLRKLPHSYAFNAKLPVNVASTNSYKDTDAVNLFNINSSIVYAWYDALMAENPSYITKTLLGNDATGTLPIYQYRFKPKMPITSSARVKGTIPKVMLIAIHNELMNFVYMYNLLEAMCKRWVSDDGLTALRNNVEFVVIPVGNPWGFDNGKRQNSNGVDINRNFPAGWQLIGVKDDPAYSGTAALSEVETQLIWASMQTEKPDVFYDCHSYGNYRDTGEAIWIPAVNHETLAPVTASVIQTYTQYKRKYAWMKDVNILSNISDDRILGGGISSKSASSLGCIGGTVETSWNLAGDVEAENRGSNIAVNFSSDFLGNLILQSIDTASKYSDYPTDRTLTTADRP